MKAYIALYLNILMVQYNTHQKYTENIDMKNM